MPATLGRLILAWRPCGLPEGDAAAGPRRSGPAALLRGQLAGGRQAHHLATEAMVIGIAHPLAASAPGVLAGPDPEDLAQPIRLCPAMTAAASVSAIGIGIDTVSRAVARTVAPGLGLPARIQGSRGGPDQIRWLCSGSEASWSIGQPLESVPAERVGSTGVPGGRLGCAASVASGATVMGCGSSTGSSRRGCSSSRPALPSAAARRRGQASRRARRRRSRAGSRSRA